MERERECERETFGDERLEFGADERIDDVDEIGDDERVSDATVDALDTIVTASSFFIVASLLSLTLPDDDNSAASFVSLDTFAC